MQKLFETIDNLKEELLEHWINISNIESPANYKKGLDEIEEYFIGNSQKQGWYTEILTHENTGNSICIT